MTARAGQVRRSRIPGLALRVDGATARLAAATGAIGVAGAMVVSPTSLFLADAVHAAPLMIGLFFAGRGAAELITDMFVGVASDRLRSRRTLLALCSLLSALGAVSYLLLRNYYLLLLAGAVFFGTGGAVFAQLFAYTREFAEARGKAVLKFNSALRAVTSGAWVIGPPLGFYLVSRSGFSALFAVAALLYLAGAAACRWGLPAVPGAAGQPAVRQPLRLALAGLNRGAYLLMAAVVLLLTVNQIYQIDLALFVTKELHLRTSVPGVLIGLSAAVEIPVMMLIGARGDRFGRFRLLVVGTAVAVLFFCALPFAATVPELLALQLLNAGWTAVVLSVPVIILQEDLPGQAGLTSSLYATAFKAGILLGGGVTGVTAAAFGYTKVFWVCAGLAAAALACVLARPRAGGPLLCSVIVPTYNRAALLRHTLDSLVRQQLPGGRFEVIVVDDGSADGTAAVVDSYRGRLDLSYYFQPDEGYRVARARNVGIAHARSAICVFADSGVILHSGCLAAFVASHRRAGPPVAVCGYVYCFNEDNEDGAQIQAAIDFADPDATMASLQAQGKWLDIREEFYARHGDDFAGLPAPWLVFWTCNASAPTAQLREVGMFDETYRSWGAEDVDLAYRLHRAGTRFVLDRRASAIHVPHPKSYAENMRQVAGNYRYFAAKYGTPITQLVVGHHFFAINDIIAGQGLPDCAAYEARRRAAADEDVVIIFSPHPDDDVIACGGTIRAKRSAGRRVIIVYSTDGSMSHAAVLGIHQDPEPGELALIRQDEARAGAARLGVPTGDLHFLGFPDTRLAECLPAFARRVRQVLTWYPGVSEIYLPHEVHEMNADHRLTGETVLECIRELGLTLRIRKFVVWDERTEAEFGFVNRQPAGYPAAAGERLVRLDIADGLPAKRAALAEHRTQVTLFAPGQARPAVPPEFQDRVLSRPAEEFWVEGAE